MSRPAKPALDVTPAERVTLATENPLRAVLALGFEIHCLDLPAARCMVWPWNVCLLDTERRVLSVFNADEHSPEAIRDAARAELDRVVLPATGAQAQ